MGDLDKIDDIKRIGNEIEKMVRGELTLWFWKYREEEAFFLESISTTFLNGEEQLKLEKMISVGRRSDYLAGRWLVKKVKEADRYYSLSHSEGVVVLAMANGVKSESDYLGVDIECKVIKEDREKLVTRFFSEAEKLTYFKEEEDEQDYFLKVWTQKEACYKYLSNRENGNFDYSKVSFFKLIGEEIANLLNQEELEVDTFWVKKYTGMVSVVKKKLIKD